MVPYNWISLLGASLPLDPALGIPKDLSVTGKRGMLFPEMSQNQYLTKFVLFGEVRRMTFFLLLCFNCHVVSPICIISVV